MRDWAFLAGWQEQVNRIYIKVPVMSGLGTSDFLFRVLRHIRKRDREEKIDERLQHWHHNYDIQLSDIVRPRNASLRNDAERERERSVIICDYARRYR